LKFGSKQETKYAGDYDIQIYVQDKLTGCYNRDTFKITVVNEPQITFNSKPDVCTGQSVLLLSYVDVDGAPATAGTFKILSFNGNSKHANVTGTTLTGGNVLPKT